MKNNFERMNADCGEKTWLTPPNIIRSCGEFDLDPCCPPNMPWQTAKRMVTPEEDGLKQDWDGKRVWLNPPYGNPAIPFLQKMAAHKGGGLLLIFGRTETNYFHEYVFPFAHAIFFFRGRLAFCDVTGKPAGNAAQSSVLVSYSPHDTEAIRNSGLKGFLAVLK